MSIGQDRKPEHRFVTCTRRSSSLGTEGSAARPTEASACMAPQLFRGPSIRAGSKSSAGAHLSRRDLMRSSIATAYGPTCSRQPGACGFRVAAANESATRSCQGDVEPSPSFCGHRAARIAVQHWHLRHAPGLRFECAQCMVETPPLPPHACAEEHNSTFIKSKMPPCVWLS